MHEALNFISNYGYLALFLLLACGIVGIPVPDETLMLTVGGLSAHGHFTYMNILIVSFLGSMTGMMISYLVGRHVGSGLLQRYGKWIHLTPDRLAKTELWFHKYGGLSIIFGYFIPGIRHVTCYLAGVTRVRFVKYLGFASIGALVWCFVFVTIGRFVGSNWTVIHGFVKRNIAHSITIVALIVVIIVIILMSRRKKAV
jgi:membrane protein DedA with SNARE-associated domain